MGYCVVIVVEGYHPQLCGSDGTHKHPMTLEDATEAAKGLTGLRFKLEPIYNCETPYNYEVMDWDDYLAHIPNCQDCKYLETGMVKK